jgi:hypothetical protein
MLRSAKPFVCCDRLEDSRTCVPIRFWNSSQNLDVNMRSRSLTGTNFFKKKLYAAYFPLKIVWEVVRRMVRRGGWCSTELRGNLAISWKFRHQLYESKAARGVSPPLHCLVTEPEDSGPRIFGRLGPHTIVSPRGPWTMLLHVLEY